jgi:NTE family protein
LPEAGITTFDLFDSIVAEGEAAARKQLPLLKALANKDAVKKINQPQPDAKPLTSFFVNSISIEGNTNSSEDFIRGKLRLKGNQVITIDRLNNGLDRLYGSKYFENVDYVLNPKDSGYDLKIRVSENPSLTQVRLGLHYDTDFKTAALLNYTQRNILFANSRFSLDVAIGDNPRVNLNYFVDRGLLPTLGFKFRANSFETRLYDQERDPINQLSYLDYSIDFFLQSTFRDAYAFGGGIQLEGVSLNQNIQILDQQNLNSDYINYYGFLDFDSFNDANFPTDGFKFEAKARIIARQEDLNRFFEPSSVIDATFSQAASYGDNLRVVARVFGATVIGPDVEYPYNIFFGSIGKNYINYIQPFIGYRYMELQGRSGVSLRADLFYQFYKNHYISLRGNVGKLEATSFSELFGSDILLDGYSLGYSFDSPIGPLEINLAGSSNHSDIYTYISLGFWF